MTNSWQITALLPLAFAALAALGCGETAPTEPPIAAPQEQAPAAESKPTAETPLTDDGPAPENAEAPAEPPPSDVSGAAAYVPPFPDRIDLFVMPKRQGGKSQSGVDESVELIGFARLNEQTALISFNGEVSPLAEGATLYGVEIISIRPPEVVLQRGRQRWKASLEN